MAHSPVDIVPVHAILAKITTWFSLSRGLMVIFEKEIKFWAILPFKKLKSDQRFKSYGNFCHPTNIFLTLSLDEGETQNLV